MFRFNPRSGLIIVRAEVYGPAGLVIVVSIAVDTGAATTMINTPTLSFAGYDPAASTIRRSITTASGILSAPEVRIKRFKVLDEDRIDFPVLAHSLPPSSRARGLLGLDFFRGRALNLDFRLGRLTLT